MDALHATLAHLDRLIGFQTVSARSNLDLIDHVEEFLASHGIAARHRAANAVFAAARIVTRLEDMAQELAHLIYDGIVFDPPYSTLHVGLLHGGTALNLVPDQAAIEFEIRSVPDADVAGLLKRIDAFIDEQRLSLQAGAPEADIVVEDMSAYPGLAPTSDQHAVKAVAELSGVGAGRETVSFGTEAGLHSEAQIPTVVCGPGDMARAHKADEWIGLDELAGATRMMERLAGKLDRPIAEWIEPA
jgi:acetylornithine deacetylase